MTWEETLKIAGVILGSLGGGGAIVFGLSNWFGKVWADRLMTKERAYHERELEKLRSELERSTQEELEHIKKKLAVSQQEDLRKFHDKVSTYQVFSDIIAEIVGDFDLYYYIKKQPLPEEALDAFNRKRYRLYGYLAILCPQEVIDAQDKLMRNLLDIANGSIRYDFTEVRRLGLNLVNEMRKDLGFGTNIKYNGTI
jgi:hypothetical protein